MSFLRGRPLLAFVCLTSLAFQPGAPFMVASTPFTFTTVANGATGISTDQAITIDFSIPVDRSCFPAQLVGTNQGPIQLIESTSGTAQPVDISISEDGRTVTLQPSVTMKAGTSYRLRIGTNLCFTNGCVPTNPHVRTFTTEHTVVNDFTIGVAAGIVSGLITAAILAKICVTAGDLEQALQDLVDGYQHPALPTSPNFTETVRDNALSEAQNLLSNLQPGDTVIEVAQFQANIQAARILALETIGCFDDPSCPAPVQLESSEGETRLPPSVVPAVSAIGIAAFVILFAGRSWLLLRRPIG